MSVLRAVYRLAIALWLGGMGTLGAIVAPSLFQTLQRLAPADGRALAGAAFGATLQRFHVLAYACGATALLALLAMALLGPRPQRLAVRVAVVGVMLGIALYSGFVVLAEIDAIQQLVGTLPSRLPVGDPNRVRFDELHVLSTRLMTINIVGALALVGLESTE